MLQLLSFCTEAHGAARTVFHSPGFHGSPQVSERRSGTQLRPTRGRAGKMAADSEGRCCLPFRKMNSTVAFALPPLLGKSLQLRAKGEMRSANSTRRRRACAWVSCGGGTKARIDRGRLSDGAFCFCLGWGLAATKKASPTPCSSSCTCNIASCSQQELTTTRDCVLAGEAVGPDESPCAIR